MNELKHIGGMMTVDGKVVCIRYTEDRPSIREAQDDAAEMADPDGPEFGA